LPQSADGGANALFTTYKALSDYVMLATYYNISYSC